MKILFDTSVLVAGMVEPHPMHKSALPWLKRARARAGEFSFFVAPHTLAELYAVLTSLPVSPRISPGVARRLVHEHVATRAKVISLSPADYGAVIRRMADLGQIDEIKTVPHVPLSHPFVERLIGTIRRELLDRTLFWTTADLEAKLLDFKHFYNGHRAHAGREGRMLHPSNDGLRSPVSFRSYRWQKHCRGLYQTPRAA